MSAAGATRTAASLFVVLLIADLIVMNKAQFWINQTQSARVPKAPAYLE